MKYIMSSIILSWKYIQIYIFLQEKKKKNFRMRLKKSYHLSWSCAFMGLCTKWAYDIDLIMHKLKN